MAKLIDHNITRGRSVSPEVSLIQPKKRGRPAKSLLSESTLPDKYICESRPDLSVKGVTSSRLVDGNILNNLAHSTERESVKSKRGRKPEVAELALLDGEKSVHDQNDDMQSISNELVGPGPHKPQFDASTPLCTRPKRSKLLSKSWHNDFVFDSGGDHTQPACNSRAKRKRGSDEIKLHSISLASKTKNDSSLSNDKKRCDRKRGKLNDAELQGNASNSDTLEDKLTIRCDVHLVGASSNESKTLETLALNGSRVEIIGDEGCVNRRRGRPKRSIPANQIRSLQATAQDIGPKNLAKQSGHENPDVESERDCPNFAGRNESKFGTHDEGAHLQHDIARCKRLGRSKRNAELRLADVSRETASLPHQTHVNRQRTMEEEVSSGGEIEFCRSHNERNKSKEDFSCIHCSESFDAYEKIKYHMAQKHHRIWSSKDQEGILSPREVVKRHKCIHCLHCNKLFHNYPAFHYHEQWCGKEEERVKCEACQRMVRPLYLKQHQKTCPAVAREVDALDESSVEAQSSGKRAECDNEVIAVEKDGLSEPGVTGLNRCGRVSRTAAVRARTRFKELSGELIEENLKKSDSAKNKKKKNIEADDDSGTVEFNDQSGSGSESDSSGDEEEEEEEEEDDLDSMNNDELKTSRSSSTKTRSRSKTVPQNEKYFFTKETLNAVQRLYQTEKSLFIDWRPTVNMLKRIDSRSAVRYLPLNQCAEFVVQTSKTCSSSNVSLDLFKAHVTDGESMTLNVGGPVWSLAWCPTPLGDSAVHQYLAVYTHRTSTETHGACAGPSTTSSLIQIWDFGRLLNRPSLIPPRMICGLVLSCGPVWEMKWCPTGACDLDDDDERKKSLAHRLGLLALATHSGLLHILSVPSFKESGEMFIEELDKTVMENNGLPRLYHVTPIITLSQRGTDTVSCLCLDWAWKDDCSLLAAGFTDGSVSLWNLLSSSPLLRKKNPDGSMILFPYQTIAAHLRPVSGIAFCQLSPNSLATCSHDRTTKLWDLREPQYPVRLKNELKSIASCNFLLWPIHSSNSYCIGGDECYTFGRNMIVRCELIERSIVSRNISTHNSTIWGASYNNWSCALASCDSSGAVLVTFWSQTTINCKYLIQLPRVLMITEAQHDTKQESSIRSAADNLITISQLRNDLELQSLSKYFLPQSTGDNLLQQIPHTSDLSDVSSICQRHLFLNNVDTSELKDSFNSSNTRNRSVNSVALDQVGNSTERGDADNFTSVIVVATPSSEVRCSTVGRDSVSAGNVIEQSMESSSQFTHVEDCAGQSVNCGPKLRFKDYSLKWSFKTDPINSSDLPEEDLERSPATALHRIAWNPNKSSHNWLAVGGQSGLLRINLVPDFFTKIIIAKNNRRRGPPRN